jgi:hypothetical protein
VDKRRVVHRPGSRYQKERASAARLSFRFKSHVRSSKFVGALAPPKFAQSPLCQALLTTRKGIFLGAYRDIENVLHAVTARVTRWCVYIYSTGPWLAPLKSSVRSRSQLRGIVGAKHRFAPGANRRHAYTHATEGWYRTIVPYEWWWLWLWLLLCVSVDWRVVVGYEYSTVSEVCGLLSFSSWLQKPRKIMGWILDGRRIASLSVYEPGLVDWSIPVLDTGSPYR